MKKLISLILCLLLCFTFIVSCEKEEEPTSEQSFSTQGSSYIVDYDKDGVFPVFKRPEAEYSFYNVKIKENLERKFDYFDRIIINDYSSFLNFLSSNTNAASLSKITEQTFIESFVIAVYRGDLRKTENYSYSRFTHSQEDEWRLVLEYSSIEQTYESMVYPDSFDFVVIPRSECTSDASKISVSLHLYIHKYSFDANTVYK